LRYRRTFDVNAFLLVLRNLGPAKLATLALVALATIGFFVYLGNRISAPNYGLLYSDLDLKDSAQIVQKLEALNVPYELRGDGAQVLVPSEQVARLRMTMAESGLPHGGSVGYELFDKSEALGTTSFVQNINQLRALEGELSRTIGSLASVQAARVHLVLPRRELFSRERQDPSASIVLKLRGADHLAKGQVAAIQHLVAAAVPGLKPGRISIVDSEGNLLARGDDGTTPEAAGLNAEEMRSAYEQRLGRTVEEMLERSLGPGKVRVEVRADMDFDRITTNTESYDPDGQVVRSTQTVSESSDSNENGEQSVTVANNLPDAQKQGGGNGGARSKNARNEETINYEISKTVKSQVREAGVVRRLSVAVLVDGTYAAAQDGTRTYQARSPEELQQLTTLVRSAIGYNQQRGDTVEVVNLRFAGAEDPHFADAPAYAFLGLNKADYFRIGETLILLVVGLLVLLFVVRPFVQRISEDLPALAGIGSEQRLIENQSVPTAALPGPPGSVLSAASVAAGQLEAPDSMIDIGQVEGRVKASSIKKIGEIVEKHPEETVAILRSWMYQSN
jgi:flagellar M-ring protein FliF